MHYTSIQHAYEYSIRFSFCEELCVCVCVCVCVCTIASPLNEQQLHHMWLLTLFTQGASSLQFLWLDAETSFFFIPEL